MAWTRQPSSQPPQAPGEGPRRPRTQQIIHRGWRPRKRFTGDSDCWSQASAVFLTHLAESARTALGRALGRRVTGRLGERVMMAASEPATIGHLEDPAYQGRNRSKY